MYMSQRLCAASFLLTRTLSAHVFSSGACGSLSRDTTLVIPQLENIRV